MRNIQDNIKVQQEQLQQIQQQDIPKQILQYVNNITQQINSQTIKQVASMLPQICSQVPHCKATDVIRLMNQPRKSISSNVQTSIKRICESLYQDVNIQQLNNQIELCQTELTNVQSSQAHGVEQTLSVSKLTSSGYQSRLQQIAQVGEQLQTLKDQLQQANQFYQRLIITQETKIAIQSFQFLIKDLLRIDFSKIENIKELQTTDQSMQFLAHMQQLTNFIIIVAAIKYLSNDSCQEQQQIVNTATNYSIYQEEMKISLQGYIQQQYEELQVEYQKFSEDIIIKAEESKQLQTTVTTLLNQYVQKDQQLSKCQAISQDVNQTCQNLIKTERKITQLTQLKKIKEAFLDGDEDDLQTVQQINQIDFDLQKLQKQRNQIQKQINLFKQSFQGLTPDEVKDVLQEQQESEVASQSLLIMTQF